MEAFYEIDFRFGVSGELSAHCVGPHKVAYCELYDHGDGTFTLNVKPQEPGKHTLTVKYGGIQFIFVAWNFVRVKTVLATVSQLYGNCLKTARKPFYKTVLQAGLR